ncbi:hypothetical protein WR25_02201 isoform A [Diploscapter pachys]|uniref:G-protein coupled receptors family 1 profile domain-containing protein n=2 Tax=Diploscapter pachys TaxID=2018661 RepID=A0A2A2J9H5_9BILA|nr:hypothetical protein WR25_02201 isoform A [Diploscapter pachys]
MILIPGIFLFSFLLTFHMNFANEVHVTREGASQTPLVSPLIKVLHAFSVVMDVFIPMVLLIGLNICLLYFLKHRRQFFESVDIRESRRSTKSEEQSPCPLLEREPVARNGSSRSNLWCRQMSKAERHVTVTVVAIVTAYVFTHLPSMLVYIYVNFIVEEDFLKTEANQTLVFASASVVTMGKVLNFLLYCLSSKHFRIQMKKKLMCLMCKRTEFTMIMRGDSAGQAGAGTQLTRSDINIRDLSDLSRILDQWLGAGKNLRIWVAKQSINRNRFEDEAGEIDTSVRSATDSPLQPIAV